MWFSGRAYRERQERRGCWERMGCWKQEVCWERMAAEESLAFRGWWGRRASQELRVFNLLDDPRDLLADTDLLRRVMNV